MEYRNVGNESETKWMNVEKNRLYDYFYRISTWIGTYSDTLWIWASWSSRKLKLLVTSVVWNQPINNTRGIYTFRLRTGCKYLCMLLGFYKLHLFTSILYNRTSGYKFRDCIIIEIHRAIICASLLLLHFFKTLSFKRIENLFCFFSMCTMLITVMVKSQIRRIFTHLYFHFFSLNNF